MSFILKKYQTRILTDLQDFFAAAHEKDMTTAYKEIAKREDENGNLFNPYVAPEYQTFVEGLNDRPHVCVRVPTAGGKTYMATYALPTLANYRTEQLTKEGITTMPPPIVLWMMPSGMIRSQTIEMLNDNSHPCGKAVRDAFDYNIRVCDIDDFDNLLPQDFTDNGIILVSTAQMFRVTKTNLRKVYAHREGFDLHFSQFLPTAEVDALELKDDGHPKHSFSNLLHLARPIVVCDEAHDFVSELSQEILRRINPACIVEWTATPRNNARNASEIGNIKHNVLTNASAADLQQEDMIKMPVRVGEHDDWEQAVQATVTEHKRLATIANEHDKSLRPIALYKATNINGDVPPATLKQYLMDANHIPEHEIAIETGDIKELAGIDLLAEDCQINHIITVEALREGWDCSFAYVLCSVANAQSPGAAEQLLGRIMRMPFAKRREHPDLNLAYVHMPTDYSSAVVEILRRNLALEQGYEEIETRWMVQPIILGTDAEDEDDGEILIIKTKTPPDFSDLPLNSIEKSIEIKEPATSGGDYTVAIKHPITEPFIDAIVATIPPNKQPYMRQKIEQKFSRMRHAVSPAKRGEKFRPLPQLLFSSAENADIIVNNESLYALADWNIISDDCFLSNFDITEKGTIFEIVTQNGKVKYLNKGTYQSPLIPPEPAGKQRNYLASWLERQIYDKDGRYFSETLQKLINTNLDKLLTDIDLAKLVRAKHQLSRAFILWLKEHAEKIDEQTAATYLFDNPQLKCDYRFTFPSDIKKYSPGEHYDPRHYNFEKHYFPTIGKFDSNEEWECAKAIDMASDVKHWIRNIASKPESYLLPLGVNRNFYPDFVAELKNGKILVIEYKGAHLSNPDTKRKQRIGEKMQQLAKGECFFAMISATGGQIASIQQKVNDAIARCTAD